MKVIKVCIRPTCDEIAHNCDKNEKHCRNCGMIMVAITKDHYEKKFRHYPIQINYETGELYKPVVIDLFSSN